MKTSVFVTGGTGFVGGAVVKLLVKQGYQVKALVRPQSNIAKLQNLGVILIEGDLDTPNLEREMADCRYLFHVAALNSLWRRNHNAVYHSNVTGTRQMLAAAKRAGIERIVYTSSVAAIGEGQPGEVVDEAFQAPLEEIISDYKKSKYLAEQEVYQAVNLGQDIVLVNPTTPMGPGDIKPTPAADIILRFLGGKMPFYVNTGLNFVDVRDVAWGHLLALEKGRTGERYILGNQNLRLKELLDLLAEITGLPAPRWQLPVWLPLVAAWVDEGILANLGKKPSLAIDSVLMAQHTMYYDPSKAIRELGLPQTPLDITLQDAIAWFTSHGYV